ncbi:hypothetical protein P879_11770 [Paragonimus westermani]|uniref:Uncharacterized protein n=1 Tax=Paragonimus westermani TaxID=34504 RepID=A0A8T0D520_9TREM|nr:hypothetical protein P879_11770 [Paragonimus westermani]
MMPQAEWVGGGLMVNWSQKRDRSQRLTYVHLLIVHEDNAYKQAVLEEYLWHVFPVIISRNINNNNNSVNKFRDTRVFFAVENAAGLSPFIHATIQTDSNAGNVVDPHTVTAVVKLRSAFQKLQHVAPSGLSCDQGKTMLKFLHSPKTNCVNLIYAGSG